MPSRSHTLNYGERRCSFQKDTHLVDEKVIDHAHHIVPHFARKQMVSHRELRNLNLSASLTSVQWGYWKDDPACLVTFRFQFQGSVLHWRFEKADIRLTFTSPETASDPVVVDYGPKHLSSNPTDETRKWHASATISASAPVGPSPNLSASAGTEGSYSSHTAAVVEAAHFTQHNHTEPSVVKFWLREDPMQQDRILLDFDCAAIVRYKSGFSCSVETKVGPVFDWLATPWPASDPIVLDPGIEFGEQVRTAPAVDFSTLTVEEWKTLVTPDLSFASSLHNSPRRAHLSFH